MEDLEIRIRNLEALYSQSCLWFFYPAQFIIKELQGLPEYCQLKSILREANTKSPKPMSFEHIEEKLARCKYPCECDFIKDCRDVCQVVYRCFKNDMLYSPKMRVVEKKMEDLFVSHLNQLHLGVEVENRLLNFASKCTDKDIRSSLARVLDLYKENMNTPPRAMRQATLKALCSVLPPVPKTLSSLPCTARDTDIAQEVFKTDETIAKRPQRDTIFDSSTCLQHYGGNSCKSLPQDLNTKSTSTAPIERHPTITENVSPTKHYPTTTQEIEIHVMRQNGHQDDFCDDISDVDVDDN